VPLRVHLETAEKKQKRTPDRLAMARRPLPQAFERPMLLWQKLHKNRAVDGMGMGSLTFRDFHAFVVVTGDRLSDGDIAAINVIEDEYHASRNEAEKHREGSKSKT
jgi:hypothetical protein